MVESRWRTARKERLPRRKIVHIWAESGKKRGVLKVGGMVRKGENRMRQNRFNRRLILWLVFCFPAGLIKMWSNQCRWRRSTKMAVSIVVAAALIMVVLPQTRPPEQPDGGVEMIMAKPNAQVYGPELTEDMPDISVYNPHGSESKSVYVVEPTPTPVPVTVYVNDGGKYYHTKDCRYVKTGTPQVTLTAALDAGYTACSECKPPEDD